MERIVYFILTTLMKREWLIELLSNKQEKALLELKNQGYLFDLGWTNSIVTKNVSDRFNKPIPWSTYPFIQFITPRLNKSLQLFEFGSGSSTFFYADKVAFVESVEHDIAWYEKAKGGLPENAQLFFCELSPNGDYSKYASGRHKKYDMIIVDGRDRVNCCINNLNALKDDGVIILDDSERERYITGVQFLKERGFKSVEFWGTAAVINYLRCTTIFYRENNWMQL
jgi:hypothetical protein